MLLEIDLYGGLGISMTKYLNREALRKAHDIYREFLSDRREHRRVEIIDHLSQHFSLTGDQRSYLSKTGKAEKHLMKEGLIERTRDGYYRITAHGLEVVEDIPF